MGAASGTAGSICGGQTLLMAGRIVRPMSPMVSACWTPEREEVVKTLWAQGKSASEIAKALGGGASRNAVIGKVHRLGLVHAGREIPAKPTMARPPRPPRAPKVKAGPRTKPPHPGPQKKPAMVFGATFLETPASDEQRAVFRKAGRTMVERVEQGCGVESPNARPFLEAKNGCKWPLAGGMVCCSRIARGVYCAGHAAVAYIARPKDPVGQALRRGTGVEACASFHTQGERIDSYRRVHANDDGSTETVWDEARAAA